MQKEAPLNLTLITDTYVLCGKALARYSSSELFQKDYILQYLLFYAVCDSFKSHLHKFYRSILSTRFLLFCGHSTQPIKPFMVFPT